MRQLMAVVLGLLLTQGAALAQNVDGKGVPYRAWDADAGVGFQFLTAAEGAPALSRGGGEDWSPSWAGSVEGGHYWTSHFKTAAGVTFLQRSRRFDTIDLMVEPGVVGIGYVDHDAARTQFYGSGTWQFLDNSFMHPYVSAGVRALVLDVTARREPYAYARFGNTGRTYTVSADERRYQEVHVRPFLAVGSKSYFSERVFARPEFSVGFDRSGLSQFGARLGIGVDF